MATRTIILDQVFDAMAMGGYEQGKFHVMHDSRETTDQSTEGFVIVDADAIGQAGLNLGVNLVKLEDAMRELPEDKRAKLSMREFIVGLNDDKNESVKDIALLCKKKYAKHLKVYLTLETEDFKFKNYKGVRV